MHAQTHRQRAVPPKVMLLNTMGQQSVHSPNIRTDLVRPVELLKAEALRKVSVEGADHVGGEKSVEKRQSSIG